MTAWLARQFQVVWFLESPLEIDVVSIFRDLSDGAAPSASGMNQATEVDIVTGQSRPVSIGNAQGVIDGVSTNITIQDSRFDLFFQPMKSTRPGAPPLFSSNDSIRRLLGKNIHRVDGYIKGVNRLAVVGNFVYLVDSIADANRHILDAIDMKLSNVSDGSDLIFSVNVRKTIDSVLCNRVIKWQVEAFTAPNYVLNMFGQYSANTQKPVYAASMIIDINSATLSTADLPNISHPNFISSLAEEGLRVASVGGVKALEI